VCANGIFMHSLLYKLTFLHFFETFSCKMFGVLEKMCNFATANDK
jgi:hypothetical protein